MIKWYNERHQTEKTLFNIAKAFKIAAATIEAYKSDSEYKYVKSLHLNWKIAFMKNMVFIHGNDLNNSFDRLYIHRACNQAKINMFYSLKGYR